LHIVIQHTTTTYKRMVTQYTLTRNVQYIYHILLVIQSIDGVYGLHVYILCSYDHEALASMDF